MKSARKDDPKTATWRAPTRRTFVAMLGAAAAALALKERAAKATPAPASPPKTRWIGHC